MDKILKQINITFDEFDYISVYKQLHTECQQIYKTEYRPHERILFVLDRDFYNSKNTYGSVLQTLQKVLNDIDISNFFCTVVTGNTVIAQEIDSLHNTDNVALKHQSSTATFERVATEKNVNNFLKNYTQIDPNAVTAGNKQLLVDSKTFCMYPWITVHALPDGRSVPCCYASEVEPLGNTRKQTLREIWNGSRMRDLRTRLKNNQPDELCTRCYEQEAAGVFSGRRSINKQFAHQVDLVEQTRDDGTVEQFDLRYWDIRFSNLCNLRCRSCFHLLSSSWYADTVKIKGKYEQPALIVADGERQPELVDQLLEHIDVVERIYFAGGEPLVMDQHYRILEALERAERFDVALIYNTNLTKTKLKDRYVFDYWRKFSSVSVGASLDAYGERAELLRKDCDWNEIVHNIQLMKEICPQVDLYVNATVSLLNGLHMTDFHKQIVEDGLVEAGQFNVNLVSNPNYLRLDAGNAAFKQQVEQQFRDHIAWLDDKDQLGRATQSYISAIEFMNQRDQSSLLEDFWNYNQSLDAIRNEDMLTVLPELSILKP